MKTNSFLSRATILLFLLPVAQKGLAQTVSMNGTWKIKDKQYISGPQYGNALPERMEFMLTNDSVKIKRYYEGPNSSTYTIDELLPRDGSATTRTTNNNNRKGVYKNVGKENQFTISVTYRNATTGAQSSADFTEDWQVAETRTEMVIEKKATEPNGTTWVVKGIYELLGKPDLAMDPGRGTRFVQGLSWAEVKAKAKKEKKMIFVDAFTTWCKPCHEMSRLVFPVNMVGDALNKNFISVKVQMDSTGKDNAHVQSWRSAARQFEKDFSIAAYPTYLFFDMNGEPVHKEIGKFEPEPFVDLVKNAQTPAKQYYTLLRNYRKKNLSPADMRALIKKAGDFGEKDLGAILKDYRINRLEKLPADSLMQSAELNIMSVHVALMYDQGIDSKIFRLLYDNGDEVDRQLGQPGFSKFHRAGMVSRAEIVSKIYKDNKIVNDNPDWAAMETAIRTKFPKVDADWLLLNAKFSFYGMKKDYQKRIEVFVKKIDKYGVFCEPQGVDNLITYTLLPHCEDTVILNKAIGWMEELVKSDYYGAYAVAQAYGNYAAVLYQAGRRKEGVEALEKQLTARGFTADKADTDFFRKKVDVFEKMKRGERMDSTWQISGFF